MDPMLITLAGSSSAAADRWGECVTAVVVRRSGSEVTGEEIEAHCEGRLAMYRRPRRVVFSDVLPRNSPGKIQKQAVKRLVTDADAAAVREPAQ